MSVRFQRRRALVGLSWLAIVAACGGVDRGRGDTARSTPRAPVSSEVQPSPGRRVITVELLTDLAGKNVFRPHEIAARPGDVLRFTLVSGAHNVNFLADSNTTASTLPEASDRLRAEGQTYDVLLSMGDGRYYFHCDFHASLGMIGHVTVEDGA
jgi:plastocyanin